MAKTHDFLSKGGKAVVLRNISGARRMTLYRVLGADLSKNMLYLVSAMAAASVAQVDDDKLPFPTNAAQVEALVERFEDDDGLFDEITSEYQIAFTSASKEEVDEAKNS